MLPDELIVVAGKSLVHAAHIFGTAGMGTAFIVDHGDAGVAEGTVGTGEAGGIVADSSGVLHDPLPAFGEGAAGGGGDELYNKKMFLSIVFRGSL